MKRDSARKLFSGLAAGFFTIATISVIGCAGNKIKFEYENKDKTTYSKKDQQHKHKHGKPPSHAKAHGYRNKHQYHYYPDCSVYFDRDRKLYFYLSHGHWEVGASLPNSVQANLGEYVWLELNTGMPYTYHADHYKKYPPAKEKSKDKKKRKSGKH